MDLSVSSFDNAKSAKLSEMNGGSEHSISLTELSDGHNRLIAKNISLNKKSKQYYRSMPSRDTKKKNSKKLKKSRSSRVNVNIPGLDIFESAEKKYSKEEEKRSAQRSKREQNREESSSEENAETFNINTEEIEKMREDSSSDNDSDNKKKSEKKSEKKSSSSSTTEDNDGQEETDKKSSSSSSISITETEESEQSGGKSRHSSHRKSRAHSSTSSISETSVASRHSTNKNDKFANVPEGYSDVVPEHLAQQYLSNMGNGVQPHEEMPFGQMPNMQQPQAFGAGSVADVNKLMGYPPMPSNLAQIAQQATQQMPTGMPQIPSLGLGGMNNSNPMAQFMGQQPQMNMMPQMGMPQMGMSQMGMPQMPQMGMMSGGGNSTGSEHKQKKYVLKKNNKDFFF